MNIEEMNKIRKLQGLSIDELSKKAGLPKSTVEKVLFGVVKHPRIDTMQAIERALNIADDAPQTPQQPVSPPTPSDEYTAAEKRVIEAYRTLVPGMQEYILEMIEKLADVDTGENKGKKVNRA